MTGLLLAGMLLALAFWLFPVLRIRPRRLPAGHRLEIVVAAYRDDLDWLAELPRLVAPATPKLTVYAKHADTAGFRGGAARVLPNVGRCDHTYLHHIVENWDRLAETTLFVTGSARHLWWKWWPLRLLLLPRLGAPRPFVAGALRPFTRRDRELELTSYRARHDVERVERPVIPARPRPFRAWWEAHFPGRAEPRYVAVGGVFAARRSALRAIPLETWRGLLEQHAVGDNPEAGHYMERAWYALLAQPGGGPDPDSLSPGPGPEANPLPRPVRLCSTCGDPEPGLRAPRRPEEDSPMRAHRTLAITAMKAQTAQSIAKPDFMAKAGLPMPGVTVDGSLPATLRTEVSALDLRLPAELVLNWTIGDYPEGTERSAFYDPASPWYGVFFGSYALRSYKRDGQAWGYERPGKPLFEEFLRVVEIDYNYFMAGLFGCPPERMSFQVQKLISSRAGDWDCAQVDAITPSGLHNPALSLRNPATYVTYGIPETELWSGREPFEPLSMHGTMYMRQVPQERIDPAIGQPITLAFGALCRDTAEGQYLLQEIMGALMKAYLPEGEGP